jgi:hypothetical protein
MKIGSGLRVIAKCTGNLERVIQWCRKVYSCKKLNATNLLQYTDTAQVENWKGTTLSFILHYQEQIWLYDQLQPPNKQTSDHAKMIYLQNAVYAIEELRLVHTTGSQLALANGTVPMYKDYEALLKLAASTYDRAHAPAKRQPTRSAKRTDI